MFSARALSKSALASTSRAIRPSVRPVLARAYHEKVISHYESPRNVRHIITKRCFLLSDMPTLRATQVGSLPKNAPDVGTGLVGAPAYVYVQISFIICIG